MLCFKRKHKSKEDVDPYVGSDDVKGLNRYKFNSYVNSKDLALVMFYHPILDCKPVANKFKKAAHSTHRRGLVFAAVNCEEEQDLCCREDVRCMPYFKLYSKGKSIGDVDDPHKLSARAIQQWVETITVYED
ncbi:hypothetical protein BsWGS_16961 [Bradybaena similaris]